MLSLAFSIKQKAVDKILGLYRKYGWKAFIGIFLYYLIRDVTLYILIPMYLLSKV
jgi:hypothetical protein